MFAACHINIHRGTVIADDSSSQCMLPLKIEPVSFFLSRSFVMGQIFTEVQHFIKVHLVSRITWETEIGKVHFLESNWLSRICNSDIITTVVPCSRNYYIAVNASLLWYIHIVLDLECWTALEWCRQHNWCLGSSTFNNKLARSIFFLDTTTASYSLQCKKWTSIFSSSYENWFLSQQVVKINLHQRNNSESQKSTSFFNSWPTVYRKYFLR